MDAFMGILNNPLVLMVVGLAVKFFPPLAKVPNAVIPYLNALLAFFAQAVSPAAAHAAGGPLVGTIAAFGFLSFLGPVGAAVWQAVQASLLNEFFLRHPLSLMGAKKAV
jgi:hypothetical protein